MITVIESPVFLSRTADFLDDSTRQDFINWIAVNPLTGDLIKGSGGMRVITYYIRPNDEVWLLMAHTKAKFDSLPTDFLVALKKELFDEE